MSVETIYWDSDCFLGHFKAEDGKAEKCDGVIQRAERGEALIVTSAFTLAEVLWMRGGLSRLLLRWRKSCGCAAGRALSKENRVNPEVFPAKHNSSLQLISQNFGGCTDSGLGQ